MQNPTDDPARLAVLEGLRQLAIETYGEERAAESAVRAALGVAATAVWRVSQEPLDPAGLVPFPTHD